MNLARVSANGQVTIPDEILRKLQIKEGDALLFSESNGEIVICNASATDIVQAETAFAKTANPRAADEADEEDVQSLLYEIRYGAGKPTRKSFIKKGG